MQEYEVKALEQLVKLAKEGKEIEWDSVQALNSESYCEYNVLDSVEENELENVLSKVAIIKLNGGLGTSMGCSYPKSLITVTEGKCFLEIVLGQIFQLESRFKVDIPVYLMNSPFTNDETQKFLNDKGLSNKVSCVVQSFLPRLNPNTFEPLASTKEDLKLWYPPGHGDLWRTLYNTGVLQDLKNRGISKVFVSNIDNLGATLDLKILKHLIGENNHFGVELTPKTVADVKGGTIVDVNGKKMLLEIAQVPKENVNEFKSISKFSTFNTNNLWFDVDETMNLLQYYEGEIPLTVIKNNKKYKNQPVLQLEQAMGDMVQFFSNVVLFNVPRTRFVPVKKTSDLLLVRSNLFTILNGEFMRNKEADHWKNNQVPPLIRFGPEFKELESFEKSFEKIPDLCKCCSFTICGKVQIKEKLDIVGDVVVIAAENEIVFSEKEIIANRIITDNGYDEEL
eukprot:TRINITY_DN253_c0_g1_i1.p1 TRINITY_DN253_c0_g1~~TRINITY_DN253_c0_g1_i1.p1  ORF type:complete len:467 (+),score=148.16 TRINITY_DN253_c0_g1_i1:48-1403(+)